MGRPAARVAIIGLIVATFSSGGFANANEADPVVRLPVIVLEDASDASVVIVEPGDNLWRISADHLENRLRRRPGTEEISSYWLTVIDANRDSLESGNPDLIYPGESISMPDPLSGLP